MLMINYMNKKVKNKFFSKKVGEKPTFFVSILIFIIEFVIIYFI